ncbi:MAG: hypothetical protein KF878_11390 [Planctomycetes bacterium]|nr:hypothetical protein [Planctomycetota bacterium]
MTSRRRLALTLTLMLGACAGAEERPPATSAEEAALRARAAAGDVDAGVALAERLVGMHAAYAVAHGGMPGWAPLPTPERLTEAFSLLGAALERGSARAMLCRAWCAERDIAPPSSSPFGRGCFEPDPGSLLEQALVWYVRAAETGDPGAMAACGRAFEFREEGSGLEWLRRAARAGEAPARQVLSRVLSKRPDLRLVGDDDLLGSARREREPPWPPTGVVADVEPFLPVATSRPDDPVRLARAGRDAEATATALALLRDTPRDPRATVVLAACDLRRAAAGRVLDVGRVRATAALVAFAIEAHPTDAGLHAALVVCETWAARAAPRAGGRPNVAPSAAQARHLAGGDQAILAALERCGAVAESGALAEAARAVARGLLARARRQPDLAEREADSTARCSTTALAEAAEARAPPGAATSPAPRSLARALEDSAAARDARGRRLRARAHARMRQCDLADARADLEAAIGLASDDLRARALLGLVWLAAGDRGRGLDELERAMFDRWLAAAGADTDRRWRERLWDAATRGWFWIQHAPEQRDLPADLACQLARVGVGLSTSAAVLTWIEAAAPAQVERATGVQDPLAPPTDGRAHARALVHALEGLARECAGDLAGARRHYRASATEQLALEAVAVTWSRQRLLALGD